MGTGLTMYRIKGTGREVRADDAVTWSGSDGGRRSNVRGRRSFTVSMVYHIFLGIESIHRSLQPLWSGLVGPTRERVLQEVRFLCRSL